MNRTDEIDRLVQSFNPDDATAQDVWNAILNRLLKGDQLYTVMGGGTPPGVAIFSWPDSERLDLFAFTSLDEARKFKVPDEGLAPAGFRHFLSAVKSWPAVAGVTINPASQVLTITRTTMLEMEPYLPSGPSERTIPTGSVMMTGEPANYPHALAADLAERAARYPQIERLWMRQMVTDGQPSYLVVVDLPSRDPHVMRDFSAVANGHPDLVNQPLDLIVLPEGQAGLDDSFSGPFYRRSTL